MSQPIPIPCPQCGQPVRVELRHAGQELVCRGCSRPFAAPKLRDLKRLMDADSPPAGSSPPDGQSGSRARPVPQRKMSGALFSGGLGLALLFGVAAYSLHRYASRLEPAMAESERQAAEDKIIEKSSVNELYAIWKDLFDQRLVAEWEESGIRAQIRQSQILKTIAWGLFAVAGCGGLTMLAAMAGAGSGRKKPGRG